MVFLIFTTLVIIFTNKNLFIDTYKYLDVDVIDIAIHDDGKKD